MSAAQPAADQAQPIAPGRPIPSFACEDPPLAWGIQEIEPGLYRYALIPVEEGKRHQRRSAEAPGAQGVRLRGLARALLMSGAAEVFAVLLAVLALVVGL